MKDPITDLADRMALLHVRHDVVFGLHGPRITPTAILAAAQGLESALRAGDPDAAARVRGVVDPADMDRSEFWATPLGRLMFVAGAFRGETCTQTVAAAVLDCSRQWVNAMVAEGKLSPASVAASPTGRGVHVEQVRAILKARIDRLVK